LKLAALAKASTSNGLVTPRNGNSIQPNDLAFTSAEIEDLSDACFFRPAGLFLARGARALTISPIGLTIIGTLIGIAGGALLYDERFGLVAFALLILHGIVDSADGQLARLTGRTSELGHILDGLSGYATHAAIYLAIAAGLIHRGAGRSTVIWMLLAGVATATQAGMYEYHRRTYIEVVANARVPGREAVNVPPLIGRLFGIYAFAQRRWIDLHVEVEAVLAARGRGNLVPDEDRRRYRECFQSVVRGWNLLGDNTRFYAVGLFALLHRMDLFFPFVLIPMNLGLIVLWVWQRRADRKFLSAP
jgi:phosphatidylglycerophosphate synthase